MILNEKLTDVESNLTTNKRISITPSSSSTSTSSSTNYLPATSNTSSLVRETHQQHTKNIRILKAFHRRDVLASVNASFLALHEHRQHSIDTSNDSLVNENNSIKFQHQQTSFHNHINQADNSSPLNINDTSASSSCISFLNNLVDDDKLNNLNLVNSSSNENNLNSTSNKQSTLKTSKKKLIRLLSLKSKSNKQVDQQEEESEAVSNETPDTNSIASSSDTNQANQQSKYFIQKSRQLVSQLLASNNLTSSPKQNQKNSTTLDKRMFSSHKQRFYPPTSGKHEYVDQERLKQFYLMSKKLRKHLPFNTGLKNHGNTCFMNCVLQCLFHTSPLCEYFVTNQVDHDIQLITHQRQHMILNSNGNNLSHPFILSKNFNRLLMSMWRNTYDPNYSAEMKQLIGYLNPTFAGVNQNDSHELCVWFLDRLSQELTFKLPTIGAKQSFEKSRGYSEEEQTNNSDRDDQETESCNSNGYDSSNNQRQDKRPLTSSFIEELVKVKFKSTVVCSKCQYKSSKYETDMMLSLPLPQNTQPQIKANNNQQQSRHNQPTLRRSLYINLILTNQSSIRSIIESTPNENSETSNYYDSSNKTKFYVSDVNYGNGTTQFSNASSTNANYSNGDSLPNLNLNAPFHSKIGVNIHISNDDNYTRQSFTTTTSNNNSTNTNGTVINPNFEDLRRYIELAYKLSQSDLVFLDLNGIRMPINDNQSIKEHFCADTYNSPKSTKFLNSIDSISVVELSHIPPNCQTPLINIICFNVFYQHQNNGKKCHFYGLPFVVLINRDCSYSELCKKIVESQFKLFKDKNIVKYKDLAERLFSLSLEEVGSRVTRSLNPTDELPLYAQFIDKALAESLTLNKNGKNLVEHIKLNVEWRSLENITNLLKDINYPKAEFVHRSVRYLLRLDDTEQQQQQTSMTQLTDSSESINQTSKATITLDDCFELFTQCEELTDENSWMCPKCKRQTNAYKKLCISSVPPILIIHLKRFFYKSKTSNFKLTTPIWFPICNLDMNRYLERNQNVSNCDTRANGYMFNDDNDYGNRNYDENFTDDFGSKKSQSQSSSRSYNYDLFAVCNHKGQNMANGHYTAFCKNLVDTRWYCFDDATCMPILDSNTSSGNLFNNGSTSICTENAYILFYKRRDCMKNEKWWKNYIDRSLLSYDDFYHFVDYLDIIDKEQQLFQQQQQQQQDQENNPSRQQVATMGSGNYYSNLNTNKKNTSLKTLRKLLGTSKNASQSTLTSPLAYTAERNDYVAEQEVNLYYNQPDSDFVCQREINNKLERDSQEEMLRHMSNRSNANQMYINTETSANSNHQVSPIINSYDETNKPHRLLRQSTVNKEAINNQTSSSNMVSPSASTTSSPSKQLNDSMRSVGSSSKTTPASTNSVSSQSNLRTNQADANLIDMYVDTVENELINDLDRQLRLQNGNGVDLLLNYPNDNDYTFSSNKSVNERKANEYYAMKQSDAYPQYTYPQNYYNLRRNYYSDQNYPYRSSQAPPVAAPRHLISSQHHGSSTSSSSASSSAASSTRPSIYNLNNSANNKNSNSTMESNNGTTSANNSNNNSNNNMRYMNPSSIETPI